jgi:hypothetical protein
MKTLLMVLLATSIATSAGAFSLGTHNTDFGGRGAQVSQTTAKQRFYLTSPSYGYNSARLRQARLYMREYFNQQGLIWLGPQPRPSNLCGGCTAPDPYDYNRN